MNPGDIEKIVNAALEARLPRSKPKMEFSKKAILGAFLFYGVLCLLGYVAWFITGEWPQQLIDLAWPLAAAITGYMGKTAYENRPKIISSQKGGQK